MGRRHAPGVNYHGEENAHAKLLPHKADTLRLLTGAASPTGREGAKVHMVLKLLRQDGKALQNKDISWAQSSSALLPSGSVSATAPGRSAGACTVPAPAASA